MNAVEVYLLGRKLMKVAEAAFPPAPGGQSTPASVRMIVADVSEHPGSSIGEIVSRTGFPQSHVSSSVARLRELGLLQTTVDSGDARRTLVELTPGMRRRFAARTAVPVDGALAAALADSGSAKPGVEDLEQIYDALTVLAQRLIPRALGWVGPEFEPLVSSEAG